FGFLFPFGGNEGPSTQTEVSAGTGFFVTSDGIIATNRHVVADESATYRVYTNDGKQYDATVLARDPVNDIALIKINGSNFPTLSLGDSDKIKVGQSVVAIGNALGQFSNTVTTGVVSGINRSIVATGESGNAASNIEGAIQTDAAINPGNSGGPLLDILGSVIGINTAVSAQGQSLGFAIPVNELKKDLRSYSQNKKIVQPFLGIRYVTITEGLQEELNLPVKEGAYITAGQNDNEPAIVPGGPADKAGLKQGDIIIKVNDKDINLENSVASVVRNFNPGDNVQITIIRDGKEQTLTVTLGDRT
ncbi:MAG TPA: trypsin-like peptidase domain-containing protein, partial [Flavobacterium sp.]|nr:trypsin-like peptidase domain-containing protein [Flavobacterium sp.]